MLMSLVLTDQKLTPLSSRAGIEPTIVCTREEHANIFTTVDPAIVPSGDRTHDRAHSRRADELLYYCDILHDV